MHNRSGNPGEQDLKIQSLNHFTPPVRDHAVARTFYVEVRGGVVVHEPDWEQVRAGPEVANIALVPGACFAIKPSVALDGHIEAGRFGHSVVVTDRGARGLGTWSQEFLQVG